MLLVSLVYNNRKREHKIQKFNFKYVTFQSNECKQNLTSKDRCTRYNAK